jgi:hypothetical protein
MTQVSIMEGFPTIAPHLDLWAIGRHKASAPAPTYPDKTPDKMGTLAIAPLAKTARDEMCHVATAIVEVLQHSPVPTLTLDRLLAFLIS